MKGKLASDVVIDRAGVMSSLFKDLLIDGILFRGPSTDVDLFVGMFATELRNFVSSSGKLTGDSFEVEWRDGEVIFTVTSLPEPVTVPGWAKASSLEKR